MTGARATTRLWSPSTDAGCREPIAFNNPIGLSIALRFGAVNEEDESLQMTTSLAHSLSPANYLIFEQMTPPIVFL